MKLLPAYSVNFLGYKHPFKYIPWFFFYSLYVREMDPEDVAHARM